VRLVHTGDLHITDGPRLADQAATLDDMISRCLELRPCPDAWIISGDLYGHTVPHRSTPAERQVLHPAIARMTEAGPVIVIMGNHDHAGDLLGLEAIGEQWPVMVITKAEARVVPTPAGLLRLWGLPYPRKAWLRAADVEGARKDGDGALRALLRAWSGQITASSRRHWGSPHIVAAHVHVAGSTTAGGEVLAGQEIEVGRADLDALGADYVALGHIHKRQGWGRAWYPGTLWRNDYSETDRKGWHVVDIGEQARVDETWPPASADVETIAGVHGTLTARVAFMESDCRDFVTLDYRWAAADGEAPGWRRFRDGLAELNSLDGAEVRTRLSVQRQHIASCPWDAEVAAISERAHRVKVERTIEPAQRVRAPEVAEADSLPDRLRAYWGTLAQPPSDGDKAAALDCLDMLRAAGDDEIRAVLAEEERC